MRKYTLQEKITKTFIVVFSCILLITAIVMAGIMGRIYWDKSVQLSEQLVSLNLDLLNNQIMDIQESQEIIAKNAAVKETVSYYNEAYKNTGEEKNIDASKRNYAAELQYRRKLDDVFNQLAKSSEVSGAYIIDKQGKYIYFYKESPKVGYDMLEEGWYKNLVDSVYMDICYVSGFHDRNYLVNEKNQQCISLVRPIQKKDAYIFTPDAFLVCDIALDSVLNNSGGKDDMQFALLDNNNEVYSGSPLSLDQEELTQVIAAAAKADTHVEVLRRNFLQNTIAVTMKAKMFGWKLLGIMELQEITNITYSVLAILAVTILVAVLLVMFLSKRVSRSILLPMNKLIEECNCVAAGDYDVNFQEMRSEEVSFLSDTIQSMVSNVVQLSGQLVEEEKKLSEEKVRVLQHQINPHFLNNVLQTIKGMAVSGETEKISRISTLLGHILAYSVYEPYEEVELKTELEYVKNYIELQNIRYDNRIFYSIDCEKEAEDVRIPKLTIQPLVENCIEHGYSGKGRLMINLSGEIEPDMVCVIISDNGRGIADEEMKELERRLGTGEVYRQKCSVGIVNVNERLKKIFGEEYGVEVLPKNTNGTTVIMRIPKRGI